MGDITHNGREDQSRPVAGAHEGSSAGSQMERTEGQGAGGEEEA